MATSHSDTAFLTMEKSFTYRGAREHWANVYHWDQVPANSSVWAALKDLLWGYESLCFAADVQFEHATGHTPGTPPVLVYESDEPPAGEGGRAGTYVPGAGEYLTPGDDAAWIRYGTTQKDKRGKPIYLRNYYHAVYWKTAADTLADQQRTKLDQIGAALVGGLNIQGTTFRRAGPRGAVAQNHAVSQFITTRTLKRRGRRRKVAVNPADARDTPVVIPGWLGDILSGAIP